MVTDESVFEERRVELHTHSHLRQLGELDPKILKKYVVNIIGAGGIGSNIAFQLVLMGFKRFVVWDADGVSNHNRSTQLYPESAVGKNKAEALADMLKYHYSDVEVEVHTENYTGQVMLQGIVVSGVDNMAVRWLIWEKTVRGNMYCDLYIEGRMGFANMEIYTLTKTDLMDPFYIKWYESKWYSDDKVHNPVCTVQAIIFTLSFLSAYMAANTFLYVTAVEKGESEFKISRLIIGNSKMLKFFKFDIKKPL